MKADDGRPHRPDAGGAAEDTGPLKVRPAANNLGGVAAGTLVVLSTLALVAYMVKAMRSAAPIEIAEVIAAASGLLAAVGAVFRAMRSR